MSRTDTDLVDLARNTDEDAGQAFIVDLDGDEGPLHLLLDLARRQKVDLLEISILTLANQYLSFIKDAQDKRIDLAADYLLMAAWLAFLKSRLLLPKPEKKEKDGDAPEDMATRLAFRLKRLDAMRRAAEELLDGPVLNTQVFLNGQPVQPKVITRTEYDTSLYHLTQAFGSVRERKEKAAPHKIEYQYVLPLESARDGLRAYLPKTCDWQSLDAIGAQLFESTDDLPPRSVLASVFAASLELARDGDVDLRQDEHFTELYLKPLRFGGLTDTAGGVA